MSKKKPSRSFWDFEPSQTNKRNPFAVDPDFDARNAKQDDDKGPAITSLPRAMMKSVKKPLTKQKQHIVTPAATPQKSGSGVWIGMVALVAAVLILSQTQVIRNIRAFFTEKKVEDVAIKPSTGPVLGEVKQDVAPAKTKTVTTKTAVSAPSTPNLLLNGLINKTVTVKTPFLNVRSDASLSAPVVGNVKQGDEVTVLAVKRSWLQIGEGRYIGASHVDIDSVTAAQPPAIAEQKEKPAPKKEKVAKKKFVEHQQIATDNIKIRTGAGPKNKVVGYLRKGTVVTVYEQKGIWLKIGEDRFVHSGNLKPKDRDVGH